MRDESDFEKHRPKITEATTVQAARAWAQGGEILSLNGKRTAIDSFILVLASGSNPHGFLMSGHCAKKLCAILIDEGFAPDRTT